MRWDWASCPPTRWRVSSAMCSAGSTPRSRLAPTVRCCWSQVAPSSSARQLGEQRDLTIRSLRAAASFLTVLPVANADGSPGERLGRAYFPAIGALIGLAAGAAFAVLSSVTTPLLAAACGGAVVAILTGAMHLDG